MVLESQGPEVAKLKDQVIELQEGLAKALAPRGPQITEEDVKLWMENVKKSKELAELITALRKDLNLLDGPKIKADIVQLFKITQNFVVKDDISGLQD
jgi:hypothetical protein